MNLKILLYTLVIFVLCVVSSANADSRRDVENNVKIITSWITKFALLYEKYSNYICDMIDTSLKIIKNIDGNLKSKQQGIKNKQTESSCENDQTMPLNFASNTLTDVKTAELNLCEDSKVTTQSPPSKATTERSKIKDTTERSHCKVTTRRSPSKFTTEKPQRKVTTKSTPSEVTTESTSTKATTKLNPQRGRTESSTSNVTTQNSKSEATTKVDTTKPKTQSSSNKDINKSSANESDISTQPIKQNLSTQSIPQKVHTLSSERDDVLNDVSTKATTQSSTNEVAIKTCTTEVKNSMSEAIIEEIKIALKVSKMKTLIKNYISHNMAMDN